MTELDRLITELAEIMWLRYREDYRNDLIHDCLHVDRTSEQAQNLARLIILNNRNIGWAGIGMIAQLRDVCHEFAQIEKRIAYQNMVE